MFSTSVVHMSESNFKSISFGLQDLAKMVLSQNYHQYPKMLMDQHQLPSMNKLGIEILTEKKI